MTNPTPHGQVPEALIDLIDAYAETRHRCGGIYNAKTEAARKAVIEALSGVQALSAAPAEQEEAAQRLRKTLDIDPGDVNDPLHPRYIAGFKSGHAAGRRRAAPAASPTPPAEQQAQPGVIYAVLPAPTASIGTDDAWHEAAMRDFADRTHAARLRCKSEQARLATLWGYVRADATPKQAAPKAAPGVGNSGFDHQTAADFLNGKPVSDEAVRTFVAASRWAHDERAALSATLLAMHGVLTSREAEIALLKKALLEAEAAPQQEPAFWTRQRFGEEREFCEAPFTTDWTPLYTAPKQEAQEPSRAAKTWCSYVAGMIGCYLNEPDESTKVQAIAGSLNADYGHFPTPQPAPDCHHRPPCNECAALAAQGGK